MFSNKKISNTVFFSNDILSELSRLRDFNKIKKENKLPKELTMNEYIENRLTITNSNIHYSLDVINNISEYNNIKFIDDVKKTNIKIPKTSNINIYSFYKRYEEILNNLYKVNTIGNNSFTLYEIMKNKNINSYIDEYLINYCGAPYSLNPIDNFIYFIRYFPFFRVIFNKQFIKDENSIFYKIISDNLDPYRKKSDNILIKYDDLKLDKLFTNNLLKFLFNEERLHNITSIDKNSKRLEDYFFKLTLNNFFILITRDDSLNKIRNNFNFIKHGIDFSNGKKITIEELGLKKIGNKTFILNNENNFKRAILNNQEKKLHCLFLIYLLITEDNILNYSNDYLYYMVSYFVLKNYFIFCYIKNIKNIKDHLIFEEILDTDITNVIGVDINNDIVSKKYFTNRFYFKIMSALYLFESDDNLTKSVNEISVEEEVNQFSHYLYLYNYFKTQDKDFFQTFLFLSTSNENTKIIQNKKINSDILDNIISIYDLSFKTSETFVLN